MAKLELQFDDVLMLNGDYYFIGFGPFTYEEAIKFIEEYEIEKYMLKIYDENLIGSIEQMRFDD